jgi:hypothetical protein
MPATPYDSINVKGMMTYPGPVKDRAYALNPAIWESYSGKPKKEKQFIEVQRKSFLDLAEKQLKHEGWYYDAYGWFCAPEGVQYITSGGGVCTRFS